MFVMVNLAMPHGTAGGPQVYYLCKDLFGLYPAMGGLNDTESGDLCASLYTNAG